MRGRGGRATASAVEYEFTIHAAANVADREIEGAWVEKAIFHPELVLPDGDDPELEHRLARIEAFGNRVLRVIVNPACSPLRVVTVYFDRTMKKKL